MFKLIRFSGTFDALSRELTGRPSRFLLGEGKCAVLTRLFFPEQSGVRVDRVYREGAIVHLVVVAIRRAAKCPLCHRRSKRVHSRYVRTIADLPCAGDVVSIHLRTRRFVCRVRWCRRKIFTERLPYLVAPFARKTTRLWLQLQRNGFALGGDPGSRHAVGAGMPVSARTLLRLVRAAPLPPIEPVVALGVDDWSQRKGHVFGTILVNLRTHKVIDLLPDRTADGLATWLESQSTIEFVTRDRAGAYAEAVRRGAPTAVQVADRFHVLKNLTDVVERVLTRQQGALHVAAEAVLQQQLAAQAASASIPLVVDEAVSGPPFPLVADARLSAALHDRRRVRDDEVLALHEQGATLASIAHRLNLTRPTVRRIVRAGAIMAGSRARRASSISPYERYLWERWIQGCQNAYVLWQEIQAQGFRGSYVHLRRALRGWRTGPGRGGGRRVQLEGPPHSSPQAVLRPFSPRQATWLLLRASASLQSDELLFLEQLRSHWPAVEFLQRLALQFGQLVRRRDHEALDRWLKAAEQSGMPEFHGFANGLRRDLQAVTAALKWELSNGQTEGQVNRLKTLKRAMYGRAKLDLLRLRLLHAS
jgi:transposase